MKNKKILITLGIVTLIAIVAIGIFKNRQQTTDDNIIRIGAILPLTGEASYLGLEIQKGMECQRRVLEEHGVMVEVVYQDSMYSAKGGISAYQALQAKYRCPVVIVAGSAVANALSEYIQGGRSDTTTLIGILVSSERSSEKNENFYRCWPSGNDEAIIMGKYVSQIGNCKNVGILYQNDELGLDGKDAFVKYAKASDLNIQFEESISKGLSDAEPIVAKLLSSSVDKVYCVGSTPGIGLVVKTLKEHAYPGGFLFTSTLDVANLRKIIGEDAISGIIYTSMFVPQEEGGPDYGRFQSYLSEFETKPNMLNVYGGVSVSFGEKICRDTSKEGIQAFETILGELRLNSRRGIDFPMYIKQANEVQLGNDTILEVISP